MCSLQSWVLKSFLKVERDAPALAVLVGCVWRRFARESVETCSHSRSGGKTAGTRHKESWGRLSWDLGYVSFERRPNVFECGSPLIGFVLLSYLNTSEILLCKNTS